MCYWKQDSEQMYMRIRNVAEIVATATSTTVYVPNSISEIKHILNGSFRSVLCSASELVFDNIFNWFGFVRCADATYYEKRYVITILFFGFSTFTECFEWTNEKNGENKFAIEAKKKQKKLWQHKQLLRLSSF